MSEGAPENSVDLMDVAARAVDELYRIRDTYFPANPNEKTSRLLEESNHIIRMLDEIPPEKRTTPVERATYEYLRGKVFDVFPEYKREAEDHLSKAVKLNPSSADAWLSLGTCIWKKPDLASAKNCFMRGLSKGPNKGLLCHLSMLERKLAQGTEEDQAELVDDSIMHAKEAICLDVADGNSWYILGNAYLTSFFVTGSWDHRKLSQSLKAYQQAEKDVRMTSNPDLYFNCAIVHKRLENYDRALSGFQAAALRDPGLNATHEVDQIIQLLDIIDSSLHAQTKIKQVASLASSASVNLNPLCRRENIDNLHTGLNKAVAIVGKVTVSLYHNNISPFYYLVRDSSQICYILSVYAIKREAIKEGDQVTVLDPCYQHVNFSWNGKKYEFRSIRVDFLEQVLVNGKALSPQNSFRTYIRTEHKA